MAADLVSVGREQHGRPMELAEWISSINCDRTVQSRQGVRRTLQSVLDLCHINVKINPKFSRG